MSKLNWSLNDVANTPNHSYRIDVIGRSVIAVCTNKYTSDTLQSHDFSSVQAARQWAQNYDDKFGEGNDV